MRVHVIGDLAGVELAPARLVIDDDDRLEIGQALAELPHLAEVLVLGDDGDRPAVLRALVERLLAERGEERLDDGTELQDAHEADV